MNLEFYKKTFDSHNAHPLKVETVFEMPMCCGVYFLTEIFMGEEVIVYVGSSKWLRQRLYCHPMVYDLKKKGTYGNMYVIPYKDDHDYKYTEKSFIFLLKPLYNKSGIKKDPYFDNIKKALSL